MKASIIICLQQINTAKCYHKLLNIVMYALLLTHCIGYRIIEELKVTSVTSCSMLNYFCNVIGFGTT